MAQHECWPESAVVTVFFSECALSELDHKIISLHLQVPIFKLTLRYTNKTTLTEHVVDNK